MKKVKEQMEDGLAARYFATIQRMTQNEFNESYPKQIKRKTSTLTNKNI